MSMKAVLIGAGGIAQAHLQAMAGMDAIEATALADIHAATARSTAGKFNVAAYEDYKRMVDEVRPDIAVIALPHWLHREAAVYCAERGCHLLLEKPMAVSSAECTGIIDAVERNGVTLLVGQTQQYIRQNLTAKQMIAGGKLGELVSVTETRHTNYFTNARPRWFLDKRLSGGGIMFNLGNHSIDKIQWLTDTRIARVRASVSFLRPEYPDIEGSGTALMVTDANVPCALSLSGYGGASGEETVLAFSDGMMKIVGHQAVYVAMNGKYEEIPLVSSDDPYALQLTDLLACIRGQRQPYASGEYARSVVRAVEAVYESSLTGREIAL